MLLFSSTCNVIHSHRKSSSSTCYHTLTHTHIIILSHFQYTHCLTHIIRSYTTHSSLTHTIISLFQPVLSNSLKNIIIHFDKKYNSVLYGPLLSHTHAYLRGYIGARSDYEWVQESRYDLRPKWPSITWMEWFKVSHTTSTSLIVHALI